MILFSRMPMKVRKDSHVLSVLSSLSNFISLCVYYFPSYVEKSKHIFHKLRPLACYPLCSEEPELQNKLTIAICIFVGVSFSLVTISVLLTAFFTYSSPMYNPFSPLPL